MSGKVLFIPKTYVKLRETHGIKSEFNEISLTQSISNNRISPQNNTHSNADDFEVGTTPLPNSNVYIIFQDVYHHPKQPEQNFNGHSKLIFIQSKASSGSWEFNELKLPFYNQQSLMPTSLLHTYLVWKFQIIFPPFSNQKRKSMVAFLKATIRKWSILYGFGNIPTKNYVHIEQH